MQTGLQRSVDSATIVSRVAVVGATGSLGRRCIEVLKSLNPRYQVTVAAGRKDTPSLRSVAREVGALAQGERTFLTDGIGQADVLINAVSGYEGVRYTLTALDKGLSVLAANKEPLAAFGPWLANYAQTMGRPVIPLDSELIALRYLISQVGAIPCKSTITATGGPFFSLTREELESASPDEALKHPIWDMGPMQSINSATLVNKVLEAFVAHSFLALPLADIEFRVELSGHVHALACFAGQRNLALHSEPRMEHFIHQALTGTPPMGEFRVTPAEEVHSLQSLPLEFNPVLELFAREGDHPCFPIALCAANERAVQAFLTGSLGFLEMMEWTADRIVASFRCPTPKNLEDAISLYQRFLAE